MDADIVFARPYPTFGEPDDVYVGHLQETYMQGDALFCRVRLEVESHPDFTEEEMESAEFIFDLPPSCLRVSNDTEEFPWRTYITRHLLDAQAQREKARHERISRFADEMRSGARPRPNLPGLSDRPRRRR